MTNYFNKNTLRYISLLENILDLEGKPLIESIKKEQRKSYDMLQQIKESVENYGEHHFLVLRSHFVTSILIEGYFGLYDEVEDELGIYESLNGKRLLDTPHEVLALLNLNEIDDYENFFVTMLIAYMFGLTDVCPLNSIAEIDHSICYTNMHSYIVSDLTPEEVKLMKDYLFDIDMNEYNNYPTHETPPSQKTAYFAALSIEEIQSYSLEEEKTVEWLNKAMGSFPDEELDNGVYVYPEMSKTRIIIDDAFGDRLRLSYSSLEE